MPPSKAEAKALAAERKAAAAAEGQRRRAEAEAKKKAQEAAVAAAAEAGMGTCCLQGGRGSQEDRATAIRLPQGDLRFAGVHDGHCGEVCADFASRAVPALLLQTAEFKAGDYKGALRSALEATHTQFIKDAPSSEVSGTTSTVAIISGTGVAVACVGNSRAVLCVGGKAHALTNDVRFEMTPRGLFGQEQPGASLAEQPLTKADGESFLILATDGVWDVLSSQKACDIVKAALAASPTAPQQAAKALCDAAYSAESEDNIGATVVICHSPHFTLPPPPPQAAATAQSAAAAPARPVAAARPAGAAAVASAKPAAAAAVAAAKPAAAARPVAAAKPAAAGATAVASARPAAAAAVAAAKPAAAAAVAAAKPAAAAAVAAAKPAAAAAVAAAKPAAAAAARPAAVAAAKPAAAGATAAATARPAAAATATATATVRATASASAKPAAPKSTGTGRTMLVNVPPGVQPGKPFVANFYGIEYEVECPPGKGEGMELTVEIEDYRGRRPRRCTVVVPGGVYPGEPMIIAADASAGDGKIEEFEVVLPEGYGPGMTVLVDIPQPKA